MRDVLILNLFKHPSIITAGAMVQDREIIVRLTKDGYAVHVGCTRALITLKNIDDLIKSLNGEALVGRMVTSIVPKKSKATTCSSEDYALLEETENFYISSGGKAYSKKDYVIKELPLEMETRDVFKSDAKKRITYRGYYIDKEDIKVLNSLLKLIKEGLQVLNKKGKEEPKEEPKEEVKS